MSVSHFFENRSPDEITNTFNVLYTSADINIFWHAVFMLLVIGVVYGGIRGGIERWSRILMPMLLGILLILFLYATTLDGFGKGFRFLFYPDISKLKPSGVLEALGHAFFTLSLGMGAIITYGSYLSKKEDIVKTSIIIAGLDTLVAIVATLVLFPIIFTYGYEPEAGPGLLFKTLPIIFSQIPGGMILSIIFFLLVVFAALTSGISLLEVVAANFIDLLGWGRKKAVMV
ncbi:MAG: sodium-dependent transporter, partial [Candidatus Marinimicrobia bacterium CG_4_10_14_0_2_um_filter_48_9]